MNTPQPAAALSLIGAALGCDVRAVRALRSVSNSAWLIDVGGARAVLRLHTLGFGEPVTDHAREIEIHALAARSGLAPTIVYSDIANNILVTEFVEAGAFTQRGAVTNSALQAIGEALSRLHDVTVPVTLTGYTLGDAADTYLRRAGAADDRSLSDLATQVRDNELAADDVERVLCHRDLLYSNILDCRPVQFIDWEFASPGERWFDLAAMIAWHKLSPRKQAVLMSAYLGRSPRAEEHAAVRRNIESFNALCTLWSLPAA